MRVTAVERGFLLEAVEFILLLVKVTLPVVVVIGAVGFGAAELPGVTLSLVRLVADENTEAMVVLEFVDVAEVSSSA